MWEKTKICVFVWVYVRDSEIEDRGKHLCTRLRKTDRVKTGRRSQHRNKGKQINGERENSQKHQEGGVRSETGYWIYTTPPCCQISLDFDAAPINKDPGSVGSGSEHSR